MRAAVLAVLLFMCALARAQVWPESTPESQGMDSAALAALVEYGGNAKMDSLVVARNGRIVAEAYYAPFRADMKHRINSATKAVVGMLTGIAIARGDLPATDAPLSQVLARAAEARDARWKAITLQDLLEMRSGIDWNEPLADPIPRSMVDMERSRNWEDFILGRGMAREPGTAFDYNSGNPHLLSIALTRRTGMSAEDYARGNLFGPLGMDDLRWRKDPQGASIGGWGLYLRTRDMAKLGQLYLQHGEWNGRAVVPSAWTARAFNPTVEMSFPGLRYADFWWSLPQRGAFMMVGFNRQWILVMPQLHLVAAMTGRGHYPFEDVIAHLQRAVRSEQALADNPQARAVLRERIEAAATDTGMAPMGAPVEAVNPQPAQAAYRFDDNPLGVRELHLDFGARTPSYRMRLRSRDITAPLGADGRFAEARDGETPLFTRSRWDDAQTLRVEQRWPEEAAGVGYVLRFRGDELEITRTNDLGRTTVVRARRIHP
jgi:CubicO group peptidase (beta-lactamase class C family)